MPEDTQKWSLVWLVLRVALFAAAGNRLVSQDWWAALAFLFAGCWATEAELRRADR